VINKGSGICENLVVSRKKKLLDYLKLPNNGRKIWM